MKILDILFVVLNLYNFVCLFKLRKIDKKKITMIKGQKATEHMNEELIRMLKIRIEGLPEEVEKVTELLEKDEKYEFLQKSENYRSRSSVYVRKYVEIRLKEQE